EQNEVRALLLDFVPPSLCRSGEVLLRGAGRELELFIDVGEVDPRRGDGPARLRAVVEAARGRRYRLTELVRAYAYADPAGRLTSRITAVGTTGSYTSAPSFLLSQSWGDLAPSSLSYPALCSTSACTSTWSPRRRWWSKA